MNKTILITGASKGLGKASAFYFAKKGYDVILCARSKELMEGIKEEIEKKYLVKGYVLAYDLTKENSAKELFWEISNLSINIDVLLNNAGFGDFVEFLKADWEKQRQMLALNIKALTELCYLFGQKMQEKGGQIINVSSVAAFSGGPYMACYYASKAYVLSFSLALKEELKKTKVKVSVICPSTIKSNFEDYANMKDSTMFEILKPKRPEMVAKKIYSMTKKKKAVFYCGYLARSLNFATRIAPRALAAKFTKYINGKPKDKT